MINAQRLPQEAAIDAFEARLSHMTLKNAGYVSMSELLALETRTLVSCQAVAARRVDGIEGWSWRVEEC